MYQVIPFKQTQTVYTNYLFFLFFFVIILTILLLRRYFLIFLNKQTSSLPIPTKNMNRKKKKKRKHLIRRMIRKRKMKSNQRQWWNQQLILQKNQWYWQQEQLWKPWDGWLWGTPKNKKMYVFLKCSCNCFLCHYIIEIVNYRLLWLLFLFLFETWFLSCVNCSMLNSHAICKFFQNQQKPKIKYTY